MNDPAATVWAMPEEATLGEKMRIKEVFWGHGDNPAQVIEI